MNLIIIYVKLHLWFSSNWYDLGNERTFWIIKKFIKDKITNAKKTNYKQIVFNQTEKYKTHLDHRIWREF